MTWCHVRKMAFVESLPSMRNTIKSTFRYFGRKMKDLREREREREREVNIYVCISVIDPSFCGEESQRHPKKNTPKKKKKKKKKEKRNRERKRGSRRRNLKIKAKIVKGI